LVVEEEEEEEEEDDDDDDGDGHHDDDGQGPAARGHHPREGVPVRGTMGPLLLRASVRVMRMRRIVMVLLMIVLI
jgi:hypothetical protein